MNPSVLWGLAGFAGGCILGFFVGGYFGGKEAKTRLEELEAEREEETKEIIALRQKYKAKLEAKEEKIDRDIQKNMPEKKSKRVDDHPIRLTEEEFYQSSTMDEIDTETLTYYRRDSVLADDNDDVVDNPVELIGNDIWQSLDGVEDDEVYVHNEKLELNFDILINDNLSYYRDVVAG